MDFKDIDDIRYRYLVKQTIENKEQLLRVIGNIDDSFTGRFDVISLHSFFMESSNMLKNAIKQFELGFFDAAFYSVRSALEIARILVMLSNENAPIDSELYQKWVNIQKFPFDSGVQKKLTEANLVYKEIKDSFLDFFSEQKERLKKVNKYIHKQGYMTFYNQSVYNEFQNKRLKDIKDLFIDFLNNSIIEVILLRLCIDPFPILLQDKSIMYKIHFQSMTSPFRESTIDFIGKELIEKYRETDYYKMHLGMFCDNEILNEATYNIINYDYYDQHRWEDVQKQLNLLSNNAVRAVLVFNLLECATQVYFFNGLLRYFSNVPSFKKEEWSFNNKNLLDLKSKIKKINTNYDGVFLSYFVVGKEELWIVHNFKLTKNQIQDVNKLLNLKQ